MTHLNDDDIAKISRGEMILAIASEIATNPLPWIARLTNENIVLTEMLARMIHSNGQLFASEGRVFRYSADSVNVPHDARAFLSKRKVLSEVWETDSFNVKTRVVAYDIDWGRIEYMVAESKKVLEEQLQKPKQGDAK